MNLWSFRYVHNFWMYIECILWPSEYSLSSWYCYRYISCISFPNSTTAWMKIEKRLQIRELDGVVFGCIQIFLSDKVHSTVEYKCHIVDISMLYLELSLKNVVLLHCASNNKIYTVEWEKKSNSKISITCSSGCWTSTGWFDSCGQRFSIRCFSWMGQQFCFISLYIEWFCRFLQPIKFRSDVDTVLEIGMWPLVFVDAPNLLPSKLFEVDRCFLPNSIFNRLLLFSLPFSPYKRCCWASTCSSCCLWLLLSEFQSALNLLNGGWWLKIAVPLVLSVVSRGKSIDWICTGRWCDCDSFASFDLMDTAAITDGRCDFFRPGDNGIGLWCTQCPSIWLSFLSTCSLLSSNRLVDIDDEVLANLRSDLTSALEINDSDTLSIQVLWTPRWLWFLLLLFLLCLPYGCSSVISTYWFWELCRSRKGICAAVSIDLCAASELDMICWCGPCELCNTNCWFNCCPVLLTRAANCCWFSLFIDVGVDIGGINFGLTGMAGLMRFVGSCCCSFVDNGIDAEVAIGTRVVAVVIIRTIWIHLKTTTFVPSTFAHRIKFN